MTWPFVASVESQDTFFFEPATSTFIVFIWPEETSDKTNEPNTPFDSGTHVCDLEESTIRDNARFFDFDMSKVPTQACTQGIGTIMKAKNILLIATGANKAQAVKDMLEGPIDEKCPASILQKHPNVTIILDEPAASLLTK